MRCAPVTGTVYRYQRRYAGHRLKVGEMGITWNTMGACHVNKIRAGGAGFCTGGLNRTTVGLMSSTGYAAQSSGARVLPDGLHQLSGLRCAAVQRGHQGPPGVNARAEPAANGTIQSSGSATVHRPRRCMTRMLSRTGGPGITWKHGFPGATCGREVPFRVAPETARKEP